VIFINSLLEIFISLFTPSFCFSGYS
jgi:hypothetical protein